jgi:hypothetical protein
VSEAKPIFEQPPVVGRELDEKREKRAHLMAVRDKLMVLAKLSEKAEGGDKDARRELRQAVRESTPEVIARISDFAVSYRRVLAKSACEGDPLLQEGLEERMRLMQEKVAGAKPTALEELLAERVVSCWLVVELMEVLTAAQLDRDKQKRVAASHVLQMMKLQESANRRYLAAIKTLAQMQRLQGPQRLQVNIGGQQVNLS